MSYKENTPQIISVLTRKLKPGKTFADFQQAHLPPGAAKKTELGYDVDYFDSPTRVINAISAEDPNIIISIGLSYGEPEEIFNEVQSKLPIEKERAKKIADVAEKIGPAKIFFVASDNNYSAVKEQTQKPLVEVTQELIDFIDKLAPQKPSK